MNIARCQMRAAGRMVRHYPTACILLPCMRSGSSLEDKHAIARKTWAISERPNTNTSSYFQAVAVFLVGHHIGAAVLLLCMCLASHDHELYSCHVNITSCAISTSFGVSVFIHPRSFTLRTYTDVKKSIPVVILNSFNFFHFYEQVLYVYAFCLHLICRI